MRIEIGVVATMGVLFSGWAISCASWSGREARRWDGCLGRPLGDCRIPAGYHPPEAGCAAWEECAPIAPAVRAWSSQRDGHPPGLLAASAYAVLHLDGWGRVVRVEVKEVWAYL